MIILLIFSEKTIKKVVFYLSDEKKKLIVSALIKELQENLK